MLQNLIDNSFDEIICSKLSLSLLKGYESSNNFINNEKILSLSSKYILPYIKRVAIDFYLYQLAVEESFVHSTELNKAKNCPFSQVVINDWRLTAHHSDSHSSKVRPSIVRKSNGAANFELFSDDVSLDQLKSHCGSIMLVHGGFSELESVSLIVPDSLGNPLHSKYISVPERELVKEEVIMDEELFSLKIENSLANAKF